jgi:trans-2,3-dihydro-3-hydroxyanthranilate isomerase
MGRSFHYRIVDVFTDKPLEGNPLAVFLDAADLDPATMQKIAKEMNLSETTFILPATNPDCAVRVRIFTPGSEMMFAGHPTIGTAYVLAAIGAIPGHANDFLLEEGIGAVPVRIERGERMMIWLTTPPISERAVYDAARCAEALGITKSDLLPVPPQILTAGNPNLFIALKDKNAVDSAYLDASGMRMLDPANDERFCVFVFTPTKDGAYSRMFAPAHGVPEDPATGSATGPLAAYMVRHKLVSSAAGTRFISEQGTKMGRRSILHVHIRGERGTEGIDVGGHVAPLSECVMTL